MNLKFGRRYRSNYIILMERIGDENDAVRGDENDAVRGDTNVATNGGVINDSRILRYI